MHSFLLLAAAWSIRSNVVACSATASLCAELIACRVDISRSLNLSSAGRAALTVEVSSAAMPRNDELQCTAQKHAPFLRGSAELHKASLQTLKTTFIE